MGQAIYSVASLFNHSCQPNIHAYFLSRTLFLRATEHVATGCPLELSYGPQVFRPLTSNISVIKPLRLGSSGNQIGGLWRTFYVWVLSLLIVPIKKKVLLWLSLSSSFFPGPFSLMSQNLNFTLILKLPVILVHKFWNKPYCNLHFQSQVGQWDCKDRRKFLKDEYSFTCECSGCSELNVPDLVLNAFRCVNSDCFGAVLDSCVVEYENQKIECFKGVCENPHLQVSIFLNWNLWVSFWQTSHTL